VQRSTVVKREQAPKLTPISRSRKVESTKKVSGKKNTPQGTTGKKIAAVQPPKSVVVSVIDKATGLLNSPDDGNVKTNGVIRLKFNHYNKEFKIHNSVLKWSDVDEVYCFSFIYKGNYRRDIQIVDTKSGCVVGTSCKDEANLDNISDINANILNSVDGSDGGGSASEPTAQRLPRVGVPLPVIERDDLGIYFVGMFVEPTGGEFSYKLEIEEDAEAGIGAEGLTIREGALKGSLTKAGGVKETNTASKEITKELLGMKVSELHTMEAIHMREQRDLEDVLFNSTG